MTETSLQYDITINTGTLYTNEEILDFANLGCICEYDLFGLEVSHYQLAAVDMPSDAERIRRIRLLLDEGYEDSIVIAHDVHTNHRLVHVLFFSCYILAVCKTCWFHSVTKLFFLLIFVDIIWRPWFCPYTRQCGPNDESSRYHSAANRQDDNL